VEIRGHDLDVVDRLAEQIVPVMEATPGITHAQATRELGKLERVLVVDRARAAEVGLGSAEVAAAVEHYVLGRVATRLRDKGDEYDVRVQLAGADREHLELLANLPIVTPTGDRVPLSTLVEVHEVRGPSSIQRIDQERVLRIDAGTGDRPLAELAADLRERLDEVPVPDGFSVVVSGELDEQDDTFGALLVGILLACFLVYSAMAMQFESVRQPLVVMASVPFAFIGIVVALLVTGTSFSMNSFLGAIVLVGIVVNNAIVLVDCANLIRRDEGHSVERALVEAGRRRFRPILMTTLTTMLGLVPLALGGSEGGEMQAPLARAVIGGLFTSTLVTLVLIPSLYLLVERRGERAVEPSTEGVALRDVA
jgi:HAE1 family hydrophobic/amphiphilic exporter-1